MKGLQLIATGGAMPGRTVTNEELSRTVDTSDEWITTRTGIRTRHWCTEDEIRRHAGHCRRKAGVAAQRPCPGRHRLSPVGPGRHPQCGLSGQAALGLPRTGPRWM